MPDENEIRRIEMLKRLEEPDDDQLERKKELERDLQKFYQRRDEALGDIKKAFSAGIRPHLDFSKLEARVAALYEYEGDPRSYFRQFYESNFPIQAEAADDMLEKMHEKLSIKGTVTGRFIGPDFIIFD